MPLTSDDLVRIQQAAALGTDPNLLGIEPVDEVRTAYDRIVAELDAAPDGVMVEPLFDWPGDTWNELIAATFKAHGEPRWMAIARNKRLGKAAGAREPRNVLKHPGHPDQSVHNPHGGGEGVDDIAAQIRQSKEDQIAQRTQALSTATLAAQYGTPAGEVPAYASELGFTRRGADVAYNGYTLQTFYNRETMATLAIPESFSDSEKSRMMQSMNETHALCPERAGKPTNYFVHEGDIPGQGSSARAATMVGGSHVHVAGSTVQEPEGKRTAQASVWSVSSRADAGERLTATLVHENGHLVDGRSTGQFSNKRLMFDTWREQGVGSSLMRRWDESRSSKEPMATQDKEELVSGARQGPTLYARTEPNEMYAEAYAAWRLGGVRGELPAGQQEWVNDFATRFGWKKE